MTTVLYEPSAYRLCVQGHAGADKEMDPVCAGASALTWALVEAATNRADYNAQLMINGKNAVIDVSCDPEEEAAEPCRQMFEIILGGLMLIAEAHPENMTIKIGG